MTSIFNENRPAFLVKPLGDLSTRMQVIDSATKLNGMINRAMCVVWETDNDCPETYDNLFQRSRRFSVIEQTDSETIARYSSAGFDHADSDKDREIASATALEKDFHYRFYDEDFHNWESRDFSFEWFDINKDATVYVASRLPFFKGRGDRAQQFHLTRSLETVVDTATESFKNDMIGVVLDPSCQDSAVVELLTMITEDIGRRPFVASSDALVADKLARNNSDVCQTLSDAKLSATQRQLAEMMCLSRTRQIISSSKSLFAQTAALMTGLKLDTVDLS